MKENINYSLQDLINIKKIDKNRYKIIFGDFVEDVYQNVKNNKYINFLEKEPNWDGLEDKEISLIVSNLYFLANKSNWSLKPYHWMLDPKFILKDPYFAADAKGMLRVILLQESPLEYRRNNIFVSSNVLEKV